MLDHSSLLWHEMLILSAIKILAFLLVRQSHHTRPIRAGPKLFWTKFLWHCTGPGTLPHDPMWFFLAARVSECVTPFGRAMVLYGLCIYSGGETGYNEILSFEFKFTLKVKANPLKLYRDLDQIVLRLWSIFGDPGLNGSQVITQTSSGLTHRDIWTHW